MSLEVLHDKLLSGNVLFTVLVELTYRCNLSCFFCYNDLGLAGEPLSREQYFELFEELSQLQVMTLVLSGGEPLSHPDFLALGSKARELGFVIRIKSNGHALRGPLARRIRQDIDPFVIELSLHGARAETHDRMTRVAGSFERLVANIPPLLDLGLRLQLNATLTTWNEGEVDDMYALADRLGVRLQMQSDVTPRDNGDRTPLTLRASDAGTRHLFEVQQRRALSALAARRPADASVAVAGGPLATVPQKNCGAGSSGLAIDPYGNVYPCVQWRRPLGNLHQQSIGEIWSPRPELDRVRELTVAARREVDRQGPDGVNMGFCPGLAVHYTGSPTEIYDAARRRRELRAQASGVAEL